MERLRVNNLFMNARKCEFDRDQMKFLGHEISSNGIGIDPRKGRYNPKPDAEELDGASQRMRTILPLPQVRCYLVRHRCTANRACKEGARTPSSSLLVCGTP